MSFTTPLRFCGSINSYRNQMKLHYLALLILVGFIVGCAEQRPAPPNVILILADDLGFSDIGCYGSEILTPNIDQLAERGTRFTQFYNAGRCSPTRASLLTGLYQHQAGVGHMSGGLTLDGEVLPVYQGFLNNQSITIAELLQSNGYQTFMSGKWHVGNRPAHWPHQRGFDKYFSFINGAGSYYNDWPFWNEEQKIIFSEDGDTIQLKNNEYYLTDLITDKAIQYVREKDNTPFFLYLAYTAPHWPLHALEEDIKKFEDVYRVGWDAIREARLQKLKDVGILPPNSKISPKFEFEGYTPDWQLLSDEEVHLWSRRMAVYAAMIHRMDAGIGRLLSELASKDELDNTIIFFLSDNGACHEPMYEWDVVYPREEPTGGIRSFDAYGYPWANVSNTPFSLFKHWTKEGGIRTPFIVSWPEELKENQIVETEVGHIVDILPTIAGAADVTLPTTYEASALTPFAGLDLLPTLKGSARLESRTLYWEHEGNRAIREDRWKLVHTRRLRDSLVYEWALYDIENDFLEQHNLSHQYPEKVNSLRDKYFDWERMVGVEDWELITKWD